ncbi:hypothetical protein TrVE_jg9282 [Triparma verrucosa]|uniref:Uncharacterized protein n=1 Tax=Triparma verrucosa TaxID=1606542 RepID=A0A9W7EVJ8_9STRA|nr:hypothetical protein TrVE_jg9282 [Triparma verrucosa]
MPLFRLLKSFAHRRQAVAVLIVLVFPVIKRLWDRYRAKKLAPSRQIQLLRTGLLADLRINCTDGPLSCHAYQLSLHSSKIALQTTNQISWPCSRSEANYIISMCYNQRVDAAPTLLECFDAKMRVFNVSVRWEIEKLAFATLTEIIAEFGRQKPNEDFVKLLKSVHNLTSEGYDFVRPCLDGLVGVVASSLPQLLSTCDEAILNLQPQLFTLVLNSPEFGLENKDLLPLVLRYYEIYEVQVDMLVPDGKGKNGKRKSWKQLLKECVTGMREPRWKLRDMPPEMSPPHLGGGSRMLTSPTPPRPTSRSSNTPAQPWRAVGEKGRNVEMFRETSDVGLNEMGVSNGGVEGKGSIEDFDPFAS